MSVYDEALRPQEDEEVPVIYAKRHIPEPKPYALFDKSNWEGFVKRIKNGKVVHEISEDFSLRVEGNANNYPHIVGFCKIPGTENNIRRLEFLSKPRYEEATKVEVDLETGRKKQVPCQVEIPPLYSRLDQSLVKKSALDEMWSKMKDLLEERGLEITQKDQPKTVEVEEKPDVNIVSTTEAKVEDENKLEKLPDAPKPEPKKGKLKEKI